MKNGKPKIESGIPIPASKEGELKAMMKKMKVGDSFLHPIGKRTNLPQTAKRAGVKLVTRTVDPEHVRVWRVK
jgi:hypothetical protein